MSDFSVDEFRRPTTLAMAALAIVGWLLVAYFWSQTGELRATMEDSLHRAEVARQGLAADLFKMALIRLDSGLEGGGYRSDLVLQVHDEVLVDVDPDESDAVEALTLDALTGAAELSVPLEVAMAWGGSWAEAKG